MSWASKLQRLIETMQDHFLNHNIPMALNFYENAIRNKHLWRANT